MEEAAGRRGGVGTYVRVGDLGLSLSWKGKIIAIIVR